MRSGTGLVMTARGRISPKPNEEIHAPRRRLSIYCHDERNVSAESWMKSWMARLAILNTVSHMCPELALWRAVRETL